MNVHEMNGEKHQNQDTYKSLLLLDEISKGESLSQRDLSKRLNIALGLVNSYVKNLVTKGYVTVTSAPAKKYAYFLTPKGFAEKTRLTYHHLQNFTNLYREARSNLKTLFREMDESGIKRVVFAGTDEVAEIAYITLQETGLKLVGVVDSEHAGRSFFRQRILSFERIKDIDADSVVLTSFIRRDEIYRELVGQGIPSEKIKNIFPPSPRSFSPAGRKHR